MDASQRGGRKILDASLRRGEKFLDLAYSDHLNSMFSDALTGFGAFSILESEGGPKIFGRVTEGGGWQKFKIRPWGRGEKFWILYIFGILG